MTIRNKWLYLIRLSLSVCLLTAFAACSNETAVDGGDPDAPGQPVTLSLQIGTEAEAPAVPLTKAAPRATDGEYIHSLVVLVTNTHDVVEKVVPFTFADDETSQMKTGDLKSCTSRSFTLTTGAKRFYAFANYEGLSELNDIQNTQPGNQLALPSTVTWDKGQDWKPGAVDDEFIPMTALREVRISSSTKSVSIELVRLLSKLEVSFRNSTDDEITVTGWSMGGFNESINLFAGNSVASLVNAWNIQKDVSIQLASATTHDATNTSDGGTYYVSESEQAGGFNLNVTATIGSPTSTDRNGNKKTLRTQILRNRVWELEVLFSDFDLEVQITSENAPIGGYPAEMTVGGGITCSIIGAGLFTLTPTLKANSTAAVPANITWKIDDPSSESISSEESPDKKPLVVEKLIVVNGKIITGVMKMPTDKEQSYTFTLKAMSGTNEVASFEVRLLYTDIFESK